MNIVKNDTQPLQATLTVNASTADYASKVNEALKKYTKTAAIKGFRKGMVPASLVKKMYGNSILFDELNKVVIDSLYEYLKENKIDIIGRPLPLSKLDDLDINNMVDQSIEFEIGLAPKIDVESILNKKFEVTSRKIQLEDKTIDEELENFRSRFGDISNPESFSSENDFFECSFKDKENGTLIEGTNFISFKMIKDESLKASILKMKVGDSIEISIFDALDKSREEILKQILKTDDSESIGEVYEMTITKITSYGKAALTQEFFDKAFGEGKVGSEEEARAAIAKDLDAYFENALEGEVNKNIYDKILEELNFELPTEFLRKLVSENEENKTPSEAEFNDFIKEYRWTTFIEELKKKDNIKVEYDEVLAQSKAELRKMLAMYNPAGGGMDDNTLNMFNENMMKKDEHVKKSYNAVMERKLFSSIKERITINYNSLPLDEFLEKNK